MSRAHVDRLDVWSKTTLRSGLSETVTDSCTEAGCNWISITFDSANSNTRLVSLAVANPAMDASISYRPGGTGGN
jgi:hypothetical protein